MRNNTSDRSRQHPMLHSANFRIQRKYTPGVASRVIRRLDEIDISNVPVISLCRVSTEWQRSNGNLTDQVARVRGAVEKGGGRVSESIAYVMEGSDAEENPYVELAVAAARRCGGVVVAESVDRIRRNLHFNTKTDPRLTMSEEQLDDLEALADGVTFAVLTDPDAPPELVRSEQTKRGQIAKNRRGGRKNKTSPGAKKAYRLKHKPTVLRLYREKLSYRRIAEVSTLRKVCPLKRLK